VKSKVNKKAELAAKYKSAFDEIIGDPFAFPEPIPGMYEELKKKSAITIVEPGKAGATPSPVNKAKPNHLDFFVDVEGSVQDGLLSYQLRTNYTFDELLVLFDNTYWIEDGTVFTQKERAEIEQIIGRILSARKISPAGRYFISIRK
jgi:hypothetical protein